MEFNWYEALGWVGGLLFSLCAIPQAWSAWKNKHSDGLSWSFLVMWFFGEVATVIYVSQKDDVLPLLVNYYLNLTLLSVIIWYRAFSKRGAMYGQH